MRSMSHDVTCHNVMLGRSYDFFVEARSAAGVGPESRTTILTAFAASKPSEPQNFAIDLQSLSTGAPADF